MSSHIAPLRLYVAIFVALLVLTGVTVAIAYVDLGAINLAVALLVASVKALLVVLYFMHVRWSSRLAQVFVVAGIFWLVLFLVITMGDYDTREWMT